MGIIRHNEIYMGGKIKYVVNYHNGTSLHKDGSDFFDIRIFKNKKKKDIFIEELEEKGSIYSLH